MRHLALLSLSALAASLGACAYNDAPQPRSPQALAELDRYLAGKVAGRPQSCLPSYRTNDMVVIDERTVLFREGSRVWRADIPNGCTNLGRPGYAMVTRQFGGSGLCSGEIVRVVDTTSGFTTGSCSFSNFVPFDPPGRRR